MKLIDKIKKNKLLYFLGVLIVGIFIVLIVRFTYAYLAANVNEARGDVSVDSDETDNLKFAVGDPLSIDATPTTLPENGENLVDTTTATATLLANSTNKTATYDYYVYFNIKSNNYTYTTEGYKPEIVLTITDPEGNLVTELANSDLEYVEAENADGTITKGFDITTASGLINIASLYEIASNSSTDATVQDWTFTVTFNVQMGVGIKSQEVRIGEVVEKPEDPTASGYTFLGWYVDGKEYDFSTPVESNLTITAEWEESKN